MSPSSIVGIRKRLGLTQTAFAVRLRNARITVSLWETGKLKPGPNAVKKLKKIARAKK